MSFVKWCELCQSEGIQSPVCLFQINFTEAVQMCKRPECLDLATAKDFRSLIIRRDLPELLRKGAVPTPPLQSGTQGSVEKVSKTPIAPVQDDLEAFLAAFDEAEPQEPVPEASESVVETSEVLQKPQSVDRLENFFEVESGECTQPPMQSAGPWSRLSEDRAAGANGVDGLRGDSVRTVDPAVYENGVDGPRGDNGQTASPVAGVNGGDSPCENNAQAVGPIVVADGVDGPHKDNAQTVGPVTDVNGVGGPCGDNAQTVGPAVDVNGVDGPCGDNAQTVGPTVDADGLGGPCGNDAQTVGPAADVNGADGPRGGNAQTVGPTVEDPSLISESEPGRDFDQTVPTGVVEHSYTKLVGIPTGINVGDAFLSDIHSPDSLHEMNLEDTFQTDVVSAACSASSRSLSTDEREQATESLSSTVICDADTAAVCASDDAMMSCMRIADSLYHIGDAPVHTVPCVETADDDALVASGHFILDLGASVDVVSQETDSVPEPVVNQRTNKESREDESLDGTQPARRCATVDTGSVPREAVASEVPKATRSQDLPESSPRGLAALTGHTSEGEAHRGTGISTQIKKPAVASKSDGNRSGSRVTSVARNLPLPSKRTAHGEIKPRTDSGATPRSVECNAHQICHVINVENGALLGQVQVAGSPSGNRESASVKAGGSLPIVTQITWRPANSTVPIGQSPAPLPCSRSTPIVLNKLAMISTVLNSTSLPRGETNLDPQKRAAPPPKPKNPRPTPKSRGTASYAAPLLQYEEQKTLIKKQRISRKRTASQSQAFFPTDLPDFSSPLRSPSGSEDGSLSSKPSSGGGSDGMHGRGRPGVAPLDGNVSSSAFVRMVKDQIRAKRDGGSGFPGYHPVLAKKPPYGEEKKPRKRSQKKAEVTQDTLATDLDRIVGQMGNVEDHAQYDSILNELFQMA